MDKDTRRTDGRGRELPSPDLQDIKERLHRAIEALTEEQISDSSLLSVQNIQGNDNHHNSATIAFYFDFRTIRIEGGEGV